LRCLQERGGVLEGVVGEVEALVGRGADARSYADSDGESGCEHGEGQEGAVGARLDRNGGHGTSSTRA
jgi:hypothetical protein